MQYFIKQWPDRTASIYAEDGYLLETFSSLQDAVSACRRDCLVEPMSIESPCLEFKQGHLQFSPLDVDNNVLTPHKYKAPAGALT